MSSSQSTTSSAIPATTSGDRSHVWFNGSLVSPSEAHVSPFDHGLLTGDGIFETMKTYEGVPFEFDRHYQRMLNAARVFGLKMPSAEIFQAAIQEVLTANGHTVGQARLRLTVTGGVAPLGSEKGEAEETVIVASGAAPNHPQSAPVITVPYRRNDKGAMVGIKTTSYGENVVALKEAHLAQANEAIFGNTEDNLCEGTGSNIFVVVDGQLITPPLSCGCLPGVTRAVLLQICEEEGIPVKEIDLPLRELPSVEEAFLSSTLREVLPISAVDGHALKCPGPVSLKLRALFRQRTGQEAE